LLPGGKVGKGGLHKPISRKKGFETQLERVLIKKVVEVTGEAVWGLKIRGEPDFRKGPNE